jgi:hypothetical protein
MPRRWILPTLLGATLLSLAGCACLLLTCGGGFAWQAMPDSGVVDPGVYQFTVTLEGNASFEFECEVGSGWIARPQDCERRREAEDSQFDVSLDFARSDLASTNAEPIEGFIIFVSAYDGKNTIGPRHVDIEMTRDGDLLTDEAYDVEYVRDEEYAGGPHCGFCDRLETRLHVWAE